MGYMLTKAAKKVSGTLIAGLLVVLAPLGATAEMPTIDLQHAETTVAPGESYVVKVTVTWSGGANEYSVQPVDVNPLDWGTVRVMSAVGRSENGHHSVEQKVEFIANEPGDYQVPELRISLSDPEATVPSESPDIETTLPDPGAYPMLKTDPFPLRVRSDRSVVWYFGGLGALLLLLLLVAVFGGLAAFRRRQARPGSTQPPSVSSSIEKALTQAQQCRVQGDFYDFYLSLHEAASLAGADTTLVERLAQRAQNTGYRGFVPTPDDMEGDLRDVKRTLGKPAKKEAPL
jgi:hypothetical protein